MEQFIYEIKEKKIYKEKKLFIKIYQMCGMILNNEGLLSHINIMLNF